MNMQKTVVLFVSLWALSCARPVSRPHEAHHRNSEKHQATAADKNLNTIADSTEFRDEDISSTFAISTEARRKDPGSIDSDDTSNERNNFPRKIPSLSLESHPGDSHEWSTPDNDDEYYFRLHQAFHRKWADDEDSHDQSYSKETNKDSSDNQPADKMSVDPKKVHSNHLHSDTRQSKEQFDVENDGMLYTPDQVLYTFMAKGESDLIIDEDTSGDDAFERHNKEDPGNNVPPSEGDYQQTLVTNGKQDGDNAIGRHHADSSSSSSSESRSFDKEDNHITDYSRRHGVDSYSSSQEYRYDFDDEGMQGDDPRISDNHDSHSYMLHGDIYTKENSQENSREEGEGNVRYYRKSMKHFPRKVYNYVDADSKEDHSPEQDESKSQEEDDMVSKEESQTVEDSRESEEDVPSRSREDATSHSREIVESSSRGQSRENSNSQSKEEDRHSRSREEGRHSRSREEGRHSQSREGDRHSRSREEGRNSQSREGDRHSRSREEGRNSQSREETHSQSREIMTSQSREEENSPSREDDKVVSTEDLRSESIEDSTSHEKGVEKSKEISDKSAEHRVSKSKMRESYSVEDVGNASPRLSESREVKRHHSRSSEKRTSAEESEDSPQDTNESIQADSRLSHSASSESSKESDSSHDSESRDSDLKSEERQSRQTISTETSESTEEENSYSRESQSREDSASSDNDSRSRSMELESRKLIFNIDHNKPLSDYDDNDCQDGY